MDEIDNEFRNGYYVVRLSNSFFEEWIKNPDDEDAKDRYDRVIEVEVGHFFDFDDELTDTEQRELERHVKYIPFDKI